MSKRTKILISISVILFVTLFFLSSIVKYWLTKNSEELIGRKLEIEALHFNFVKVSIKVKGLKLYEQNATDIFVSFDELYLNFSPWKLIGNEYAASQIYIDGLEVAVIQNSNGFNFDDLTRSEQVEDSIVDNEEKRTVKFAIHNIEFRNGNINYHDKVKQNHINLDNLNLALPLIAWNNEKSEMGVNFSLGEKGKVSIDADIDHPLNKYHVTIGVESIDLSPFTAYLTDYMRISAMEGDLEAKLNIDGSLEEYMDVALSGKLNVHRFLMKDSKGDKFVAAKSAFAKLDSMNIQSLYYRIGEVRLNEPEIYAALFQKTNNITDIFQPVLAADSTVNDTLTEDAEESELYYNVDTIIVTNGYLKFDDNTLNRPFSYELKEINVQVGQVSGSNDQIPLSYSMNLNGGGSTNGKLIFSLKDVHRLSLQTSVNNLELMSFSPYTEFFIARPITQGEFNYSGELEMTSARMNNLNRIRISEIEFGDKTKDSNTIKAPVRLALYLLKDQNDNIEFDLPVSGNPNDPEFGLKKIIWKTLLNFLVKTASKPFGMLGNLIGENPESIQKIPFNYEEDSLSKQQKGSLRKIAEILKKKPELTFNFTQETNLAQEKELVAFSECVKRFLASKEDEQLLDLKENFVTWAKENVEFKSFIKMNDEEFNRDALVKKCKEFIGSKDIEKLLITRLEKRNSLLRSFMQDSLMLQPESYQIKTADLVNISEQQRKPNYRVEVSLKQ